MRWVMTRVFPDPAPARIIRGPSVYKTASFCGSLRPSVYACGAVMSGHDNTTNSFTINQNR